MEDLKELYQQVILDHYHSPRNFGRLSNASGHAEGFNPLCGDRIEVEIQTDGDGRVVDVAFTGGGCAIFTAAASMMTDAVKGKTRQEVERLFEGFRALLTGDAPPEEFREALGKLAIFAGVREFPVRVKCATLPWHTVHAAIRGTSDPVTTE
jgi:nitrogen fixation NifU-like protein